MQHHLLFLNTSQTPFAGSGAPVAGRRWRPIVAALGLLSLSVGASAQNRALFRSQAAAEVARPLPAASVAVPSPPVAARQVLSAISSTAAGGSWSAPATWVGGVVPTVADDVTIVAGATVTLDVAASGASVTIAATGSLLTSATTAYSLQVAGGVTNNGVLDLSNSSTIGSDLRFTGAGNAAFTGTGTTDLQTVSLAKSVRADIVEMNLPTLSVQGSTTTSTGFLSTRTTTNTVDDMTGTLKISGTATISNRVFSNAASYVIPATGGFWLNDANFTVAAQTGSPTVNGLLRISTGTYNVGVTIGNSINFGANAVYTMEGGTLNTVGRFTNFTSATAVTGTMTFTLSAGTINVSTVGNTSGTPSFGVNGANTISGGNINLVQRSTATTPLDYYVAGTYTYTGGTVNVGTAATATNFDFRVRGNMPNLTIDNTTNPKTALLAGQANPFGTVLITPGATLNLNGFLLLQLGAAITNNGTLTGTTTGSRLYFQGATAQSISGTGTVTSALAQITFQNSSTGVTIGMPITVRNVAMFRGNVIGANNLTVQASSTALAVISFGLTNPTSSAGSFDVAPTFDVAASGLYLIYNPELAARTTGVEVPASRTAYFADFNNPLGVTLAGGDLTLNGPSTVSSIGLLSGIVTTSPTSRLISGVTATIMPAGSATAYVKGPLGATVNSATAVSRLFAVGDATGFRPVVVAGITASTDQTFTATVVAGATGGTGVSPVTNLNPTRYVRLENTANLPATATVQLSYGADDVLGNAATTVVAQAPTAAGAYASIGGAAATVPTTGLVSTTSLTPGNDFFVLANTEGGTLASSVAAVCAGTNAGTITLTNNVGTIVKYQADSGTGFVDVAGTNTTGTYAFSNLTVTTTFRAVILTADNRTVFSAPVTVTVNPAPTATLAATSATTFCGPGALTLAATPVTGATYQYHLNGANIAGATSATYTATVSSSGSYKVVVSSAAGCAATSAPIAVTVNPATTATFAYSGATFCASGTNPTPTVTGTAGGTFSSTTGLSINATTGAINLGASTPGSYSVTYSVAGTCPSSATASVTISSAPSALFSYAQSTNCSGGVGTITPTFGANSSGGTFTVSPTGLGLTVDAATGVVSLANATAGTYTVTNTIAASGGCASATATATITISPGAVATLMAGGGATFCQGGSVVLTAAAATGNTYVFLLNGAAIAGATSANYTATASGVYSVLVTNASGCSAPSAGITVTVNPATTATFSYSGATFCATGTNPTATVTGTAGGTFSSATGLSINATTGAINLSASTPGSYSVTYTVAGTCGSSATASVTITAGQLATFSYGTSSTFCVSGTTAPAVVLGTGASAGTYSSTTGLAINATTGAITLSSSTPSTYTVTNTVAAAGGCAAATATSTVTITAAPTATFSYATTTGCIGSTAAVTPTLGTGASAGTYSSTTGLVINATTGAINLATSTAGTYTVTNTVAAASGCAAATATATFTVNPRPATPTISVVYNGTTTTLTSSATTGNQFYLNNGLITGATGQTYVVNGTPAQLGSYTVTTTNANGCVSLPSTALVVTSSVKPLAGTSLNVYPNPTHDGNLKVELTGYRAPAELTVFNALGQVVFTAKVPASNGTTTQAVNLTQLSTGIYILRVKTEGGLDTRRVVKE